MRLLPSAHRDGFTRDTLPPFELWPELRFELPELRYPERLNCAVELLDNALAEGHGDRPAMLCGDAVWTYADMAAQVNRVARVLTEDLGAVPGNRVLLRAPNTPMMFVCWLAVMKAGLVAVSTMPLLRAFELRQIVEKARIGLALCDASLLAELEQIVRGLEG